MAAALEYGPPEPTTSFSDPDAELVRSCQSRDAAADESFRILMDRHSPRIVRRAARILGNESDAEDILQDVFVNVHRFIDRYESDRPFSHWLSVVTLNACRLELRRRAGRDRRHEAYRRDPSRDRRCTVELDPILRSWLEKNLSEMREPTRTCIVLRVMQGLSYTEIAQRENASVPAVKMRVARGLRVLRERFVMDSVDAESGVASSTRGLAARAA